MTSTVRQEPKTRDGPAAAGGALSPEGLRETDAYGRASNALSVGHIYLLDNPLPKEPLRREYVEPRLPGHGRSTPGLNALGVHPNGVADVISRLPPPGARAAYLTQALHEPLIEHRQCIARHGEAMPATSGRRWGPGWWRLNFGEARHGRGQRLTFHSGGGP